MSWRRIPPALSPVPPLSFARAAGILLPGRDPRDRLARMLATMHDAERVLLTDSGTSALMLAMRAVLDRAGGRGIVALPGFACFDLATAAVGAGARIALYDVDPATLGPDPASLARIAALGPAAIVVAMPFGLVPDWEPIRAIADAAGAVLINDAAQSHGGLAPTGTAASLGPLAVLSFGRGKGWTGGAGGALLARADGLALIRGAGPPSAAATGSGTRAAVKAAVLSMATHPVVYRVPASLPWLHLGETHYRAPSEPRAMARTAAALILGSRAAAEQGADRRRRMAAALADGIVDDPGIEMPAPAPGTTPGYLRFPIRTSQRTARHLLRAGGRLGVAPTYPYTLAQLPAVRERRVDDEPLTASAALCRELVTLPTHGHVRERDRHRIRRLVLDHDGARGASIIMHAPTSAR